MSEDTFQEDLIKGRIAETVFELMFREGTKYEVYPLGYEHITPSLCSYYDHPERTNNPEAKTVKEVLQNISDVPDFFLANKDKTRIYFVEVKYRKAFTQEEILKIAKEIAQKWNHVWLFVASENGFFFESCGDIIKEQGVIKKLDWVNQQLQNDYLQLLNRFEK